jgi:hypothetical protein
MTNPTRNIGYKVSFLIRFAKVKQLAPSLGGGARFIPEKYKQSIVEIYTYIYKKEDSDINPLSSAYTHLLS